MGRPKLTNFLLWLTIFVLAFLTHVVASLLLLIAWESTITEVSDLLGWAMGYAYLVGIVLGYSIRKVRK